MSEICVETRVGTVAHILRRSKRGTEILFGRRSPKSRHLPGKLIGPGGGQEPDETIEECLAREVFEESGLVVNLTTVKLIAIVDYYHRRTKGRFFSQPDHRVHFFDVPDWQGCPKTGRELVEFCWFPLELWHLPFQQLPVDMAIWCPLVYGPNPPAEVLRLQFFYADQACSVIKRWAHVPAQPSALA